MKKILFSLFGIAIAIASMAKDNIKFANTIEVLPSDTKETIIAKAAHVVPTANQYEALKNEFIAFVHFGPNTFSRREWGTGFEDPKDFRLESLDTDQWCEAMAAAGMKMVILTVKHHDGFCIWQSRYTTHGIMSSDFQGGKGDVLRDLSASCKKYGLKLGIYLSPADLFQIEQPDGLYGNLSPKTERTIPRDVPGRPFANQTKFKFVVDDYNEYFLNQLFELLTEYGEISEVWFDGAHPKRKGGQRYNYAAWRQLIRTLAPKAVIFGREDVRWCGNENGGTRNTEWNVVTYQANPDTLQNFYDMTDADLGSRDVLCKGKYLHYQQAETNTSIREGWFYRDDEFQKVRSTDDVFDIYERAVGGNSTFLLNIPPNREGRFSPEDAKVLHKTGDLIRETYGTDLFAKNIKRMDVNDAAQEIVVTLDKAITFNRLMLQEPVLENGERVEKHAVDAWINNQWQEIAAATNIGYKRILRFPDVTTAKLRIRILESRLKAKISHISAHYFNARPPQLTCWQNDEGLVTIEPKRANFNWNDNGENPAANLNGGFKILYTTDGSTPNASSAEYTGPFKAENCDIKALAILKNTIGVACTEHIGYAKSNWKTSALQGLTIDLGEAKKVSGFAYIPCQHPRRPGYPAYMAKGTLEYSDNGTTWKHVETFEFGNLVNDPTKRYLRLADALTTRFLRITALDVVSPKPISASSEVREWPLDLSLSDIEVF